MMVRNVHERKLNASMAAVGAVLDSLASDDDLLWPGGMWPSMKFDRPLSIGATGGHGPIRYWVEAYHPGRSVRFRFLAPVGFDGFHGYDLTAAGDNEVVIRHTLEMRTRSLAVVSWPLLFRPLHDALIEDSLARAEESLGLKPLVQPWSRWVKLLRRILAGGKTSRQVTSMTNEQQA